MPQRIDTLQPPIGIPAGTYPHLLAETQVFQEVVVSRMSSWTHNILKRGSHTFATPRLLYKIVYFLHHECCFASLVFRGVMTRCNLYLEKILSALKGIFLLLFSDCLGKGGKVRFGRASY